MRNFIVSKDGTKAIERSRIESIFNCPIDMDFVKYEVKVGIIGGSSMPMAIFDSTNAEENLSAAKAYMAELVAELNGELER